MSKNQIKLLIALIILAFVGVIVVQNAKNTTTLSFLFWDFHNISVVIIIIAALLFGSLIMLLVRLFDILRKRKQEDDELISE